ncbi:unnamed protein product [Lymnaea stagnalis]|uniref:Uncharacterized protein n=1 Tax=Lymnaea stagnalis TaxID=6523 RepID=A0AAV2I757_LYMST
MKTKCTFEKSIAVNLSLIFSTCLVCIHCQNINLTYTATECAHGFIKEGEDVSLQTLINKDIDNISNAQMVWKSANSSIFKHFRTFNLTNSTEDYEVHHTLKNAKIFYRIPADMIYSGAHFVAKILLSDSREFESQILNFPHIYNGIPDTIKLFINGNETIMNETNCEIALTGCETNFLSSACDINILFVCESQHAPCLIELYTDKSYKVVKRKNYAEYHLHYIESENIILYMNYDLCTFSDRYKKKQCKIKTEKSNFSHDDPPDWQTPCIAMVVCNIVVIVLEFILCFVFKRVKRTHICQEICGCGFKCCRQKQFQSVSTSQPVEDRLRDATTTC